MTNFFKDREKLLDEINSATNYADLLKMGSFFDEKRELMKYILLPETKDHPDIQIAREVTHKGKNWHQAQELLKQEDSSMLSPDLFAEFLRLLKSEKRLYDGLGNLINLMEGQKIKEEITEKRNPWRSEWLDNKYVKQGGIFGIGSKLAVVYHKFDSSGKLVEVIEKIDADTMMQNKTPGINLEYWINNPTSQGLPKQNNPEGSLVYWYPRDGNVAGFIADAGRVVLCCGGDPAYSYPALGVRRAKIFQKN